MQRSTGYCTHTIVFSKNQTIRQGNLKRSLASFREIFLEYDNVLIEVRSLLTHTPHPTPQFTPTCTMTSTFFHL